MAVAFVAITATVSRRVRSARSAARRRTGLRARSRKRGGEPLLHQRKSDASADRAAAHRAALGVTALVAEPLGIPAHLLIYLTHVYRPRCIPRIDGAHARWLPLG